MYILVRDSLVIERNQQARNSCLFVVVIINTLCQIDPFIYSMIWYIGFDIGFCDYLRHYINTVGSLIYL